MAIINSIKRQLRSVITWDNPDPNLIFSQWTENGDEIKNASKLIVGPGQGCIFVYEGQVRAVIEEECLLDLETANIPFWTTIKKFMQFFESEHKVGIYFYRTTTFLDQKWGTTSPVKYEDPKYQFPVGLKAYGNYSYRVYDARDFFTHVVGGQSEFLAEDFRRTLSARIIHTISDYLAESRYSYAEIDSKREEIAHGISIKLSITFRKLGFDITDFRIEGTEFDASTQQRINRIADLIAESHAAEAAGLDYTRLQQLEAMREAARNEGGGAGLGMGMGAGIGLGQSMAQSLNDQVQHSPKTQPKNDPMAALTQLKKLFEADLISEDEYRAKKQSILDSL